MIDFEGELATRIGEETKRLREQVVAGAAADFTDYKARVAEISGLTRALEIAKDIRKDMNKE